jgi:peroxiredoxin Q/BCP
MDDENGIHLGRLAPDFTLPDQNGKNHRLSDYRGQWVFLYFYPKDATPGCIAEACAIRDCFYAFEKFKATVFGINTDSIENNKRLVTHCDLPFAILSDIHKKVMHQYHALTAFFPDGGAGEIERMSFLIDVMGDVEKIYRNIKPKIHAEEVLRDLAAIKKEGEEKIEF